MKFNILDGRQDPETTAYYGGVVTGDRERQLKNPDAAAKAFELVIALRVQELRIDDMEPVPDAHPEIFTFIDANTGKDAVAWRLLCRRTLSGTKH